MATVVIEEAVPVVIEVGVVGPQGPPGTLIEVEEDGAVEVTPLRNLDFRTGFDITEPTSRTAQIDLDLSEVAAGGELAGTLDAPTVDALHSGSTHQSLTDNLDAHLIDVVDAHDASAISFTPTGTMVSADAQSAIVEALTDGKAYTDDGHVILSSQRGATDGVAELDATGKVPAIELPAFSLGEVFTVASEGEMLALAATQGDLAVRTDVSQTFILADDPATVLGNWVELLNPASPVTSVNTRTGSVTGLEEASNKGAAGGYPSLDVSGYVPDAQINPTIARDTEVSSAISTTEAYADAADAALSSPSSYSTLVAASLGTGGNITTNPKVTSSIAPSGSIVFAFISTALSTGAPTVSSIMGLSGTWTEITNVTGSSGQQRLSLWIGTGCSGSGTLSIALSGTPTAGRYNFVEFTGIDTVTPYESTNVKTQGAGATAPSSSVTPNGLSNPANAFLVGTRHGVVENVSPLNSAIEINDDNPNDASGIETNYKLNASGAMGGSWSTSVNQYTTVGVEIRANQSSPGGSLVPKSVVDAKGDLIVGTADNVVDRLAIGTNGAVLVADSSTSRGVSWRKSEWDPRDYGADPTGARSSDAAFAAMLSELSPSDGLRGTKVKLHGAYLLTRPLYLKNQAIRFEGDAIGNPANYSTPGNGAALIWGGPGYVSISSATYTAGTVTVTTSSAHGFSTGDRVTVAEVTETVSPYTPLVSYGYNGAFAITVTGTTTFTYSPNTAPFGNADAATGVAGFSMVIVEQSARDHFSWIFFQGNRAGQPVDLLYFNKPTSSSLPGANELQGADHCLFGGSLFTSPVTYSISPLYRNARYGVRFGGMSANNDKFHFEHCEFALVRTGFKTDQVQSLWGTLDDIYVQACDYGVDLATRANITNFQCNRVAYSELKLQLGAYVDVVKWDSENLGNGQGVGGLYLEQVGGSDAYRDHSSAGINVNGAFWRIPADFTNTNMVQLNGLGGDTAIIDESKGGARFRALHVEYNAGAPTPKFYARSTTSSHGSFLTVQDSSGLQLSDFDVAAGASGGGLDVRIRLPGTDVQTHLASGRSLDTTAHYDLVTGGRFHPERYEGTDAAAIQAAADAAFAAGGKLVLQPGKTYSIGTGLTFKCDVDGWASTFSWTGGSSGACISCGDGSTTRTQYRRMILPQVVHASPNYVGTDIGVRVWSLESSTIYFGRIFGFTFGVLTIGGASVASTGSYGPVQNNQYFFDYISAAWPLRIEGGLSWNNECNYHGGQLIVITGGATRRNIHLRYTPIPPVAVSLRVDSTAGQVDAGAHTYSFTYVDVNGHESGSIYNAVFGYTGTVTNDGTHTSNDIVVPALSAFNMVGLPDAASINLYRTKVGASVLTANLFRVATTMTPSSTYVDSATDASLPNTHPAGPAIGWGKPDSHRFHDVNVEGTIAQYAVECEGSWCVFNALRYEGVGGPVFRGAGAYRNTVYGGMDTNVKTITETLGAANNVLIVAGTAGPADHTVFTPTSTISATDVQSAIVQLATATAPDQDALVGVSLATGSATPGTFTTASVAPTTSVVFVVVSSSLSTGAPTVTSITGLSGSWSELGTIAGVVGTQQRVSLWIGTGCSGSGTLSVVQAATPTNARYSVLEFTGVDIVAPYVVGSVKTQAPGSSATSSYITPNALARTKNAILVATHHGTAEDVTPLNGATEINDTSSIAAAGVETNFLVGWVSGTLGGSWATSTGAYMSIGVEVQAPYRLVLPTAISPAQTTEGSVVWDSDDDKLTVGTGSGRKTLANADQVVASLAKSGASALTGAVTLSQGAGISLTEAGQDIQIAATGTTAPTYLSIAKWGTN